MSDFGQKTTPLGRGQGGDEDSPISDNGPPFLVEDRGVGRELVWEMSDLGQGHPSCLRTGGVITSPDA
jgi:hypothetical protein